MIFMWPLRADNRYDYKPDGYCHPIFLAWYKVTPDSKVHGVNMGPIWGRQDPGGPHLGPMNFAIWDICRLI